MKVDWVNGKIGMERKIGELEEKMVSEKVHLENMMKELQNCL